MLLQQHFRELWLLFAFSRDFVYKYSLQQRHFKAHTWHQLKKKKDYDSKFYAESPEEYSEITETLHDSSKEDAKEYMIGIYKMIIRWCNDEPTLIDGESSTGSNNSKPNVTKSDDKKKMYQETVIPL